MSNNPYEAEWPWSFPPCCLHERLEEVLTATPNAPAVSFEDGSMITYSELFRRADALADVLRSYGLGPDDLVGVRVDRSIGLVVSLLGVLRSGAAYVAIDPSFPLDRQAYILQDSGAMVLISSRKATHTKGSDDELPSNVVVLEVGPLGDLIGGAANAPSPTRKGKNTLPKGQKQDPRSLAYVLYTSGSTGKPKGVEIEHAAIVSFLETFKEELNCDSSDVILGYTTYCFDISLWEIFGTLLCGARIHMVSSQTQKDPGAIVDIIEDPKQNITFVQATPATFEMLMHFGWRGNPRVQLSCGGEAFRLNLGPLVTRCKAVTNAYGPTEATVYATVYRIPAPPTENVPVGYCLKGYSMYVLDAETLKPVGPGEAGELLIGGIGLARGYHNRPELTAEKFIPNPFGAGRLYRTGDLCKWRQGDNDQNDGIMLYLGRMDSQVKVNGYRIELGEVEETLQTHPDVGTAAVLAREDVTPTGARALVAYVKLNPEAKSQFDEEVLKAHLAKTLPHYMVPRFWVQMRDFPFTPNGKIDRKALGPPSAYSPTATASSITAASFPAPSPRQAEVVIHEGESPLCGLVCKSILAVSGSEVTPDSALASVGIDSLGSMVLVRRLSEACGGIRFPVALLYQLDTVRDLAVYLHERVLEEDDKGVIARLGLDRDVEGGKTFNHGHHSKHHSTAGPPAARLLMAGMPTLQGLRGLMILWVVFEHYMYPKERALLGWRMGANTFLFVLLSGLTCYCQAEPAASKGHWRWGPFIRSRAVGIFPIYFTAILLNMPRYLSITSDKNVYSGGTWTHTGWLATNYPSSQTYAVDALFYLTGMQTWVPEVNHRGLNSLYYASVQWNLYLLFAVAAWLYQSWRTRYGTQSSTSVPFVASTLLFALGLVGPLYGLFAYTEYYRPEFLTTYYPTLFLPCFIVGMVTAWYFTNLAQYTSPHTPIWWKLVPASARRGWANILLGRLWAHSMDALTIAIVAVTLRRTPVTPVWDRTMYLVGLPLMTSVLVLMLLLTPTDRRVQATPFIKIILESEWAQILGKLSFGLYLFHEVIGDVYLQMAVKGLFKAWGGLLPPANSGWPIKWQVFVDPWMSQQSFVLKLAGLSLSISVAWIVTTYFTDGVFLDIFVHLGNFLENVKCQLCGTKPSTSTTTPVKAQVEKGVEMEELRRRTSTSLSGAHDEETALAGLEEGSSAAAGIKHV